LDHPLFEAVAVPVIQQAQIAMPLFFILSGLVLTHVYAQTVPPAGRQRSDRAGSMFFMISRIARLYPLHLAGLLLILPLAWRLGEVTAWPLLANFTLTQTFVPDPARFIAFNQPSWSLSTELFLALAFPLVLPLVMRLQASAKLTLLIALALAPLLAAAAAFWSGVGGAYLLYYNPLAHAPEFLGGMLIYELWRHHRWRLDGALWEAAALALFLASLFLTLGLPMTFRYTAVFLPADMALIAVLLAGDGPLRRLLASRVVRFFGQLAFGFYVIHYVVIGYAGQTGLAQFKPGDPWQWLLWPGLVAVSMLAALFLHYAVELSTQKRLRRALEQAAGLIRPAPRAAS